MSRDIIVLTPNGRRQKVNCKPDTNILQILEEVCERHGFEATEYELKHHNHILDLTTTIRFSNLPNKACLEMVESEKKRIESNVTVALTMDDGERRTGDFSPNTTLHSIVTTLASNELKSLNAPTIVYMRQEVIGEEALKAKTLKNIGLISGRAIIRLLNKADEPTQANVSSIYRSKTLPEKSNEARIKSHVSNDVASTSQSQAPSDTEDKPLISTEVIKDMDSTNKAVPETTGRGKTVKFIEEPMEVEVNRPDTSMRQENLERRLKIEDEVTFLGTQKAIAFMQPDVPDEEIEDLPDDFYDLTIEEVRRLYHDLQQQRMSLENLPLMTATKKEDLSLQSSKTQVDKYKSVVVRIQFPDHIILQGIFTPSNKIKDVFAFVKQHLNCPDQPFHIFTIPLKESVNPEMTLLEAKFVPCVHLHFKWLQEITADSSLKKEIYSNLTPSDAASILASKYRAPTRRTNEEPLQKATCSTSSKLPKWFKK